MAAVLLENFSIFYNEDDTELSHAVVKDFKQNWLFFDKDASVSLFEDSRNSHFTMWSCVFVFLFRALFRAAGLSYFYECSDFNNFILTK